MAQYTIIDSAGEVMSFLSCPEELIELNTPAGYTAISSTPATRDAWWNGTTWVEKSARPSEAYAWDSITKSWVYSLTLEETRSAKLDELDAWKVAIDYSSFTYRDKTIEADTHSRSLIDAVNGYVALTGSLPNSWIGGWKASDGSVVPIASVEDWQEFYGNMVHEGQANFVTSETLRAQINAATTIDQILAITIPS